MQYHITYKVRNENRDKVQDKFKKTGALPPDGVKMTGRWHSIEGNKGYLIAESTNRIALGKWIQDWSDILTFEVIPVLTDEEVGKVIS